LNAALPVGAATIPLVSDEGKADEMSVFFRDKPSVTPRAIRKWKLQMFAQRSAARFKRRQASKAAACCHFDLSVLHGMLHEHQYGTALYFGHFISLLHLETLAELHVFQRKFSRPLDTLVGRGIALTGLDVVDVQLGGSRSKGKGRKGKDGKGTGGRGKDGNVFKGAGGHGALPGWPADAFDVVTFRRTRPAAGKNKPSMGKGDCVLVSRKNPLKDAVGRGIIVSFKHDEVAVCMASNAPSQNTSSGRWRIDLYANHVVYERQMRALLSIARRGEVDALCKLLVSADVGKLDSWVERSVSSATASTRASGEDSTQSVAGAAGVAEKADREAAEVEHAKQQKSAVLPHRCVELACEQPSYCSADDAADRRTKVEEAVKGMIDLNESQRSAVADATMRRCSIIQGPPGTHVSVKVLCSWVKTLGIAPVLATSGSNTAVDNIAEGLHRAGIRAVRVGRPEKCREHLTNITLDSLLARKTDNEQAEDKDVQAFDNAATKGSEAGKGEGKSRRNRAEQKRAQLEILQHSEVICITTVSAGGAILQDLEFPAMLIDEVAQATEISAVVPVALRGARQVVLVGDHCQLPPSVVSREAEMRGLSLSLYQRLVGSGIKPYFLDTQYRSHPRLVEFAARVIYKGSLRSSVEESARPIPKGVAWPNPAVPVAYFETSGRERLDGESRANPDEASCLVRMVEEVLSAGELTRDDIGIVAPYSAQVRLLRRLLWERLPHDKEHVLEVGSVDQYQGREKEIIFFSAVRSNRHGGVGFLADWRRLNVMLTRARRGLAVFGSRGTLMSDEYWRQWIDWCDSLGAIATTTSERKRSSQTTKLWDTGDLWQTEGAAQNASTDIYDDAHMEGVDAALDDGTAPVAASPFAPGLASTQAASSAVVTTSPFAGVRHELNGLNASIAKPVSIPLQPQCSRGNSSSSSSSNGNGNGHCNGNGIGNPQKIWAFPNHCQGLAGISCAILVGDQLCTGCVDGQVWCWKGVMQSGSLALSQQTHICLPAKVTAMLHHAPSGWLFFGLATGQIRACKPEGQTEALLEGHTAAVTALQVHEAVLISGAADGTIRLWRCCDGSRFECQATLQNSAGPVSTLLVQLPESLWVGGMHGINCLRLTTMQSVGMIASTERVVALLPIATHVLAAYANGMFKAFSAAGLETFSYKPPEGQTSATTTVALMHHPNGQVMLLCGQQLGVVMVYDVLPEFNTRGAFCTGYRGDVSTIVDIRQGGLFATCGLTGDVTMWRWGSDSMPMAM